jgi:ankyrin repeat protein
MVKDENCSTFDCERLLRWAVFEQGLDVASTRNEEGCTLLHWAVINNCSLFIQSLFRVGCWDNIHPLKVDAGKNCKYETKTAEEIAKELELEAVQKELDNCTQWEKSLNAIHKSARAGNVGDVEKLLASSSNLHTELDCKQCSSLYWACIGGNLEIVKLLLSAKVDHTQVNIWKENLLHAACKMGHSHLIEILVKECNQDPVAESTKETTPIYFVSSNGDEKSLEILMNAD